MQVIACACLGNEAAECARCLSLTFSSETDARGRASGAGGAREGGRVFLNRDTFWILRDGWPSARLYTPP